MDAPGLRRALVAAADAIRSAESELNSLDAAIGDGDHGITMRTGFDAIRSCIQVLPETATISEICERCGDAFIDSTGGAIGIIFGEMLHGAGKRMLGKDHITSQGFREMLLGMQESIQGCSKAIPGDKTILDAVHAAASVEVSGDLAVTVSRAATAAGQAVERTAAMICRTGRASRLGQRSIGHPDPGAAAFAVILGAFARSVAERAASSA